MKRIGVVLPYLLARSAIDAGTVVTSLKHLNQQKHKSTKLDVSIENGKLLLTDVQDFSDLQSKDQGAAGQLDETFQELCEDVGFRKWFEKAVRLSNVYFVVGFQTLTNADVDLTHESGVAAEGGLEIDTDQAGVNVEANIEAHKRKARATVFKAMNEQIYAVEYRKVVFKSILRKDIDSAALSSKQFWKSYLTTRGDTEEKFIHAGLADIDLGDEEEKFEVVKNDESLVILVEPNSV